MLLLCVLFTAALSGFPAHGVRGAPPVPPSRGVLPPGLQGEFPPAGPVDLILMIDASLDSASSSGADVNGDGRVDPGKGVRLTKGVLPTVSFKTGKDSILAAELLAARRVLEALGGRDTRVGVVLMAQPFDPHPCELVPEGPGAEIIAPLTRDRAAVAAALDRIAARNPGGASNLAEGIKLSVSMLTGMPETGADARPDARRGIYFFGYRAPTFPFGSPYHTSPEDIALAERTARVAAKVGIRLEVFAFGKGEGNVLDSLARVAAITGGGLTRVPNARRGDLGLGLP